MYSENSPSRSAATDLARESLYRYLAAVAGGPYSGTWVQAQDPVAQDIARAAADWLGWEDAPEPIPDEGFGPVDPVEFEVGRMIDGLRASPEELCAEYDRTFGLIVPRDCPPYETEYYPTLETFARSQQIADVAGFYRAFGIEPARSSPERPDHLALELEFMAFLLMKKREALAAAVTDPAAADRAQICDQAQRDFFREHLAWWLPSFAAGLRRKAGGGYHNALAGALAAWVPEECRRLGIEAVLRPGRPELIEAPEDQSGCSVCPLLG